MIIGLSLFSQTNPTPFSLSGGDFAFTEWAATSATGTFPAGMVFHYTNDPTSAAYDSSANGNADYDCSYAATSRCRFNGIDLNGVSIVATTSAQYDNCTANPAASTRFTGAAVVALDATNRQNLQVTFTGGTVTKGDGTPTPRQFVLLLQYRYNDGAGFNTWQDVPGPVQYVSDTTGHSAVIGPVTLPSLLNGKNNIQIRWVYYQTAANSGGTRPKLRLDDISVTSQPLSSEYINVTGVTGEPFCISSSSTANGSAVYSAVGTYNTTFRVKLSDETGSFASPTEIGSLAVNGTDPTGSIDFVIPSGLASGSLYRIRVDADSPAITGFMSSEFSIITGVESVTGLGVSACGTEAIISWTNPSNCFGEVMIVMQENNPFTVQPAGDGSAYTANNAYGAGTAYESGFVVYKGTASPQTITAVQSNKNYYVAIFSRSGSNWSAPAEFNFSTTVQPVTGLTVAPGNSQADISWADPVYCFDEVMIIVKGSSAITAVPTGDGSLYTASPLFGSGTAFDGGYVMYKGTVSPQTFTGFTNGVTYYVSVFVRLVSDWSIATETTFITVGQPQIGSYILPKYMEGKTPTNNQRVALAFWAELINLLPDSTYRYFTRAVNSADLPTSNGAGGSIFANKTGSFIRASNPTMGTAGEYGEFTASATGTYEGWFILEPSGNAKFTPGAFVFPRIFLNNGSNGTFIQYRFTPADSVKVLGFGLAADSISGTGVVGITGFTPKNFVFLYDNTSATGRPLYGAHVEISDIDFLTTTVYVPFYTAQVYNINGNWGGIVPNINANGIMAIQELSLQDGSVVGTFTSANSVWYGTNTINPTGGAATPLIIDFFVSAGTQNNDQNAWYVSGNTLIINNAIEAGSYINIYNVLGQNVISQRTSSASVDLNLPEGTYMIKIENDNNITTGKFIIVSR